MQITKIKKEVLYPKNTSLNKKNIKVESKINSAYVSMPAYAYKSLYCNDVSFCGFSDFLNKISGKKVEKTIDYSDKEQFSTYLADRIQKTVHNRSEEEITTMIDEIAEANDVTKDDVQKVMARVVQFTSYSQLPQIFQGMLNCNANSIYPLLSTPFSDLDSVLRYVGYKHHQMVDEGYRLNKELKDGLFFDDKTIEHLKELKDGANTEYFDYIKNDIEKGDCKLFIVDGWNTKIDGKDMTYGPFGARYDLKTVVDTIVKEQKKTGKSLDEIMNADSIRQIKEIFGEDVEVNVIKNQNAQEIGISNLQKMLHHKAPDKKYINAFFTTLTERFLDKRYFDKKERNLFASILAEYFDKALCIYSSETLNDEMKTLYSKIEEKVTGMGKTMQDVVYLIPSSKKSFSLINYQYAKVNDIPSAQFSFTGFRKEPDFYEFEFPNVEIPEVDLTGKVAVVLDDFSGSGDTLLDGGFFLNNHMANDGDKPIILATVCALSQAEEKIQSSIEYNNYINAHFITNKVFDYQNDFVEKLSSKQSNLFSQINIPKGYDQGTACVAFPYMLPDNNTPYSIVLLNSTNNRKINNQKQNLLEIVYHIEKLLRE